MTTNLFVTLCLCVGLTLTSCSYQFGETNNRLKGRFYIDALENKTSYRLFASELQSEMVRSLRRQKDAQIADKVSADVILNGTITSVEKRDKEIEAQTGRVIESQFIIHFELRVTKLNDESDDSLENKYVVSNVTYRNSSGVFRIPENANPGQPSTEEATASTEAIKDLADAVFLSMSGAW